MKISVAILLIVCTLSGCTTEDQQLKQAMELRKKLMSASNCSFHAVITADYGDDIYTFQMDCDVDAAGNLSFTVTDPETINGITGTISQVGAALTFDDKVLAFPMLADDQITPVIAPWVFINTLKSGYLSGCSKEDSGICIYIDDSFEEDPLHLLIYVDNDRNPVSAEIIYDERRVISMDIRDFTMQ